MAYGNKAAGESQLDSGGLVSSRDKLIDLWEKRNEGYRQEQTDNAAWQQEQADLAAYEEQANQGWLDRGIQGAATGAAFGPLGAAIGGGLGGLVGFVEGGISGEKAGYDDPWLNAASPIRLDATTGASSFGAGSAGTASSLGGSLAGGMTDPMTLGGTPTTPAGDSGSTTMGDPSRFTFEPPTSGIADSVSGGGGQFQLDEPQLGDSLKNKKKPGFSY